MHRWKYYRILVVVYAAAALSFSREFIQSPEDLVRAQVEASQVVAARYPELPQHIYNRGLEAARNEDYQEARRLFEEALSAHFYTDESLLHTYASLLIYLGESQEEIDRVADLWRKHFPHSRNPDPRFGI